MEKLRFKCRIEEKVTDHGIFNDKVNLGDGKELVQCLGCGALGVMDRANAK